MARKEYSGAGRLFGNGSVLGDALNIDVSIGGPTSFKTTTRKWREASQFAAEEFPVLIQIEPTEAITPNKVGMRNRASLEVKWIAFFQTDPADPTQVGAVYLSDMMDAIDFHDVMPPLRARRAGSGRVRAIRTGP